MSDDESPDIKDYLDALQGRTLYVWRCKDCEVTWVGGEAEACWSCGENPSHLKPYRPTLIVGAANMGGPL